MWKQVGVLVAVLAGSAWGQSSYCPMVEQGWKVAAKDIQGGIELDFTTTGNPMGVRARVHQLEAQHNHVPAAGVVPSKAEAQDTSNGARLVVVAEDPARVDDLRNQMRARVSDCVNRR